jgi:uncharacterized protein DUF6893
MTAVLILVGVLVLVLLVLFLLQLPELRRYMKIRQM